MGVTLAAGNSLNWFKETFASELSFEELTKGIGSIAIGSEGLLFAPYIVGERTPYVDSQIRGSFIGIDTQHELKHFVRAVLEGITFSLKDTQVIMENVADKKFKRIVSVGGGAQNLDWLQMQADIFNATITTLTVEQGPGLGAAMLAAIGCGWFADEHEATKAFVAYANEITPISENVDKYAKIYQIYSNVYQNTKDICHELLSI
jgi:Sugar (pentulose and hexulose) kinases